MILQNIQAPDRGELDEVATAVQGLPHASPLACAAVTGETA